jgi:hypothetical protein
MHCADVSESWHGKPHRLPVEQGKVRTHTTPLGRGSLIGGGEPLRPTQRRCSRLSRPRTPRRDQSGGRPNAPPGTVIARNMRSRSSTKLNTRPHDATAYRLSSRSIPSLIGLTLRGRFRANHHEWTGGRAPRARDCSFVYERNRTSTRPTVCDDKHLILVALRSTCRCLAIGTGNAHGGASIG